MTDTIDMQAIETNVSNVFNIIGIFFSSQPWFIPLEGIVSIAIATVEYGAAANTINKADKKTTAINNIDQACQQAGVYKFVSRDIVMALAGPAIDVIIWTLNTFVPGWNKGIIASATTPAQQ